MCARLSRNPVSSRHPPQYTTSLFSLLSFLSVNSFKKADDRSFYETVRYINHQSVIGKYFQESRWPLVAPLSIDVSVSTVSLANDDQERRWALVTHLTIDRSATTVSLTNFFKKVAGRWFTHLSIGPSATSSQLANYFKNADERSFPSQYRTISLLSVTRKLFQERRVVPVHRLRIDISPS